MESLKMHTPDLAEENYRKLAAKYLERQKGNHARADWTWRWSKELFDYSKPTALLQFADNIKEDRTPEDLLFQVMLDLGVLLSSKIEETVRRVQ